MPKRQKCSTCSTGWCSNHLFELKPIKNNLYFRKIQKVRLCPRLNKASNTFNKTLPLINKDGKFYTPSFILEQEQAFYSENDNRMQKNHQQKIDDMVEGGTCTIVTILYLPNWKIFCLSYQLIQLVANHGRKRKYCALCQQEYEDYLEHIKLQTHKDKIKKSRYTGYIKQMAEKFEKLRIITITVPSINLQQTSDVTHKISSISPMEKVESIEKNQVDELINLN